MSHSKERIKYCCSNLVMIVVTLLLFLNQPMMIIKIASVEEKNWSHAKTFQGSDDDIKDINMI